MKGEVEVRRKVGGRGVPSVQRGEARRLVPYDIDIDIYISCLVLIHPVGL